MIMIYNYTNSRKFIYEKTANMACEGILTLF